MKVLAGEVTNVCIAYTRLFQERREGRGQHKEGKQRAPGESTIMSGYSFGLNYILKNEQVRQNYTLASNSIQCQQRRRLIMLDIHKHDAPRALISTT